MKDNPQEALPMEYLAGLMDGEGSFCICRQPYRKNMEGRLTTYHFPSVRIGMTEKHIIQMIHNTFGVGKFYDEGVRKDRPTNKAMYRWTVVNRKDCIQVIDKLLPYLRVKKRQAELVKKFCVEWKDATVRRYTQDQNVLQFREDLYLLVKKLNKIGALAETE